MGMLQKTCFECGAVVGVGKSLPGAVSDVEVYGADGGNDDKRDVVSCCEDGGVVCPDLQL
jgi:hypothetical protein